MLAYEYNRLTCREFLLVSQCSLFVFFKPVSLSTGRSDRKFFSLVNFFVSSRRQVRLVVMLAGHVTSSANLFNLSTSFVSLQTGIDCLISSRKFFKKSPQFARDPVISSKFIMNMLTGFLKY